MFHYCGHNVTAMRIRWPVGVAAAGRNDTSKLYKLHFQSANWTTAFEPSPKCVQCCPDCKTSLGGHGGCTCDCNPDTMIRHDPPLLFNIDDDKCVNGWNTFASPAGLIKVKRFLFVICSIGLSKIHSRQAHFQHLMRWSRKLTEGWPPTTPRWILTRAMKWSQFPTLCLNHAVMAFGPKIASVTTILLTRFIHEKVCRQRYVCGCLFEFLNCE